MLDTLKRARLLWPAVMTAVALPILVGFGSWQLQRKSWKDGLIVRIEARARAAPVGLETLFSRAGPAVPGANSDIEYTRVSARGHFLHDFERPLYALDEALGMGQHIYTPFETEDGRFLVMVNRGFVPESLKSPSARAAGQMSGEVSITGLVRGSEAKPSFTPPNDVKRNLWYFRDVAAMADGVPARPGGVRLPFAVALEAEPSPPGGWPKGGVTRLELPNRHLEYVLTWYGLAATLFVMFVVFARQRLKALRETT